MLDSSCSPVRVKVVMTSQLGSRKQGKEARGGNKSQALDENHYIFESPMIEAMVDK